MTDKAPRTITFKGNSAIPKAVKERILESLVGEPATQTLITTGGFAKFDVFDNYIKLTPVRVDTLSPHEADPCPSAPFQDIRALEGLVIFEVTMKLHVGTSARIAFESFKINGEAVAFTEDLTNKSSFGFEKIEFTNMSVSIDKGDFNLLKHSFVTFHGANAPFREYALKQLKEQE